MDIRPNDTKGAKNGKCNDTACTDAGPAIHFNSVMQAWYCTECAREINELSDDGEKLCDWPTDDDMYDDENYIALLRK